MSLLNPVSPEYKKARRLHLKTTRNRDPQLELDWTPFRAAEKKYKARFPPPDLSNVLDLAAIDPAKEPELRQGGWRGSADAVEHKRLVMDGTLAAFVLPRIPGLVILPGFISSEDQKYLIEWALSEQARHPNETNLDAHYLVPAPGIWETHLKCRNDQNERCFIQPRAPGGDVSSYREEPGPRRLVGNEAVSTENYVTIATAPKLPPTPSMATRSTHPSTLLSKLRWANIGWSYHWGTKQYDFSKGHGSIHRRLRDLCKTVVARVDWKQVYGEREMSWGDSEPGWTTWNETYEPDAGIVNFYQTKDTLMAHVDRSEVCATSPLVSVSLGNAAVFLIGGQTRDSEPVPILVRSGDVVIMSGPDCRRAYHGIPRILEGTLPPSLLSGGDDWDPYSEYMLSTRININVRQVFPKGFEPPLPM